MLSTKVHHRTRYQEYKLPAELGKIHNDGQQTRSSTISRAEDELIAYPLENLVCPSQQRFRTIPETLNDIDQNHISQCYDVSLRKTGLEKYEFGEMSAGNLLFQDKVPKKASPKQEYIANNGATRQSVLQKELPQKSFAKHEYTRGNANESYADLPLGSENLLFGEELSEKSLLKHEYSAKNNTNKSWKLRSKNLTFEEELRRKSSPKYEYYNSENDSEIISQSGKQCFVTSRFLDKALPDAEDNQLGYRIKHNSGTYHVDEKHIPGEWRNDFLVGWESPPLLLHEEVKSEDTQLEYYDINLDEELTMLTTRRRVKSLNDCFAGLTISTGDSSTFKERPAWGPDVFTSATCPPRGLKCRDGPETEIATNSHERILPTRAALDLVRGSSKSLENNTIYALPLMGNYEADDSKRAIRHVSRSKLDQCDGTEIRRNLNNALSNYNGSETQIVGDTSRYNNGNNILNPHYHNNRDQTCDINNRNITARDLNDTNNVVASRAVNFEPNFGKQSRNVIKSPTKNAGTQQEDEQGYSRVVSKVRYVNESGVCETESGKVSILTPTTLMCNSSADTKMSMAVDDYSHGKQDGLQRSLTSTPRKFDQRSSGAEIDIKAHNTTTGQKNIPQLSKLTKGQSWTTAQASSDRFSTELTSDTESGTDDNDDPILTELVSNNEEFANTLRQLSRYVLTGYKEHFNYKNPVLAGAVWANTNKLNQQHEANSKQQQQQQNGKQFHEPVIVEPAARRGEMMKCYHLDEEEGELAPVKEQLHEFQRLNMVVNVISGLRELYTIVPSINGDNDTTQNGDTVVATSTNGGSSDDITENNCSGERKTNKNGDYGTTPNGSGERIASSDDRNGITENAKTNAVLREAIENRRMNEVDRDIVANANGRYGITIENCRMSEVHDVIGNPRQSNVDIDLCGKSGFSSLHRAAKSGDIDTLRTLIMQDVDMNARDKYGYPPVHYALARHHYKAALFLMDCGADLMSYTSRRVQEYVKVKATAKQYLRQNLKTTL